MPTHDLFSDSTFDSTHGLHIVSSTFSPVFWDEVVALMVESRVAPSAQLLIVPDGSMGLAYRQAWARHAQRQARACVVPQILTLMNWARANGAQDWDAQHTERTLSWMQSLPSVPALMQVLGHNTPDDVMGLARQLIGMSDELSVHLLAGRDVAWVKKTVSELIEQLYAGAAHHLAHEELQVLLHCWSADAAPEQGNPTPVVEYLRVLRAMAAKPAFAQVWVLRNRAWTAHEVDFWQSYAEHACVMVLDVRAVAVQAGAARVSALHAVAQDAHRYIDSSTVNHACTVQVYAAPSIEDEAQAVVHQVLLWLEADSNQRIALVALDRQVSRRVWALLQRVGVDIRDDTGWLLSTSRASSAWFTGLHMMQGEVLAADLLELLAHPLVQLEDKEAMLAALRTVADQQVQYQKSVIWDNWADWQHAVHQYADCAPLHAWVHQAHELSKQWTRARSLGNWARAFVEWAQRLGLWTGLNADGAGQVWCALMARWSCIEDDWAMPLATVLRLMSTEVEQLTYRPERALEGQSESVVLMPLGNTRLRMFDAVWLMGADARNLPSAQQDVGLLNSAVRRALGLPHIEEQQTVLREALYDVLALNLEVRASYCTLTDGAPNALSPWLKQYLRATAQNIVRIEHQSAAVNPALKSQHDISSTIAEHVPAVVSATSLNRLSACPYQYYVRDVLSLVPIAQPQVKVTPNEIGNAWHAVIERFHSQRDVQNPEQDDSLFTRCIEDILREKCTENPRYWALLPLFESYQSSFIAWWHEREQEGWHQQHSEYRPEQRAVQSITDAAGAEVHQLQYKGQIDQVDVDEAGALALIDYKTNDLKKYKKQVSDNDDVQLAFYVNLISESASLNAVTQALYVGVNKEQDKRTPVVNLGNSEEIMAKAAALRAKVNEVFAQLCAGEPLRAMGQLSVCGYCDYRAVCRKDYTVAPITVTEGDAA